MRIGILGSGLIGSKLGTVFARSGHEVVFSYSRQRTTLESLAREAGPNARAGTPHEAALAADALLLAVHWSRIPDVLEQAGDLSGKVLITCCLPRDIDNTVLLIGHTSSGAEELAKRVPGTPVVSAFHTIPNQVLPGVFARRNETPRPGLILSGDDAEAKKLVARLIQDIGFDPIDAGPLSIARYTEPFALLVARLAYGGTEGPDLAYRFEHFPG